jgi:hypothetical protein
MNYSPRREEKWRAPACEGVRAFYDFLGTEEILAGYTKMSSGEKKLTMQT